MTDDQDPRARILREGRVVGPKGSELVAVPEFPEMDDTDRVALGGPRFRREERVVTILSSDSDVVPWFKQKFTGTVCECEGERVDTKEEVSSSHLERFDEEELSVEDGDEESLIQKPFCEHCFATGIVDGYVAASPRYYKLLGIYIEWGGLRREGSLLPSGTLEAALDFEYYLTPGDFFELGRIIDDVGFNVNAGIGERHDREGSPCLWRVLDVNVVYEEGFPICWRLTCRNVERYEPVYAWYTSR